MDKNQETFDTWNKVALLYQDKFMNLDLYNETYDAFCDAINETGSAILDIGCGPGNITKYLLSKRADFKVLGIDVASKMIDLARKNNPAANFDTMDCRDISTIQSKFDGIISGFCLPYLSPAETGKFIADCYQLLNNNGVFYASFVEGNPDESGFKVSATGDRVFFYYHDLPALEKQLYECNFINLKTFKVNYQRSEDEFEMHTILMAKKNAV